MALQVCGRYTYISIYILYRMNNKPTYNQEVPPVDVSTFRNCYG